MESIGKILKKARLKKGLTIEELEQATKIQKKHLLAIENDAFEELPSTYYGRTFIKQYAAEVDEDGMALVRVFDDKKQLVSKRVAAVNTSRSESNSSKHQGAKKNILKDNLPLTILFIVAAAIILLVGFLTLKDPGKPAISSSPKENKTETMAETDATDADEVVTNQTDSETAESDSETQDEDEDENDEKLSVSYIGSNSYDSNFEIKNVKNDIDLELEAVNETCWIGIQVDGDYIHDEMLAPGKTYVHKFTGKPTDISVVVGNVSNLKVKMNKQAINYNPENEAAVKKNANFSITYQ